MGHKIPARANRLGVWVKREKDSEPRMAAEYDSLWFSELNTFAGDLKSDWQIRQAIIARFGKKAGISKVKLIRKDKKVEVVLHSIRPANILGKENQRIEELTKDLRRYTTGDVHISVLEANQNDSQIIAEKIAYDLERRVAFRRAAKAAISKAMSASEVIGIKVIISGRLGGAEIARTEWYLEGKVPLHTWYANIDNGFAEAETTYGIIGVKVILHRSASALTTSSGNTNTGSTGGGSHAPSRKPN
ncbi:MAG: 30S ribosomal protein S3 [Candidatus Caenarcaniphilales bacterium]|nr:30S ribosomal protein S3 [Candidatus Caenarcaniphilales bacterium]